MNDWLLQEVTERNWAEVNVTGSEWTTSQNTWQQAQPPLR